METIQIELKNKNALSILKSLERAKMIKLISKVTTANDSPLHFKGSISPERTIELVNEIEKSRDECDERFSLVNNCSLITNNEKDFRKITGLHYIKV